MKYKINEKEYDSDSGINQEIIGKFVRRNVFCHVGGLIEEIVERYIDGDFFENWENMEIATCPNCGEELGDSETGLYYCTKCEDETPVDWIGPEILEYYAVSDYLYEQLKEKGEAVAQYELTNVWGRCATGQAILFDYVISEICYEMEILDGQTNEWKIK